jgi:hypothetical protein
MMNYCREIVVSGKVSGKTAFETSRVFPHSTIESPETERV